VIRGGRFVEEEKGDLGGNLHNEVGTTICMKKNGIVAGRVVTLSPAKLATSHSLRESTKRYPLQKG
jgi:hypothetical protein